VTEKPSIIDHIDFLCSTDANSYPVADKLRNINVWYGKVVASILDSAHGWKWDDSNYTDFPRGVSNLVASQTNYELPPASMGKDLSTFLTLDKIAVLNSDGDDVILEHTDASDSLLNNTYDTDGLPKFYKLEGMSVKIWPAASATETTLTDGLIVYYTRMPDLFTNADTTQEPGFPAIFHEILAIGAAYEYKFTRDPQIADRLFGRIEKIIKDIQDFYSNRNEDTKIAFKTKQTSFN
jgi:hypothetical protein